MESEHITLEEGKHVLTGASSASRWFACPGSVALIRKLGPKANMAGMDAALGTSAHSVLSSCLIENKEPWEFAGQTIHTGTYSFVVDQDMLEAVLLAYNTITDILKRTSNVRRMVFIEKTMQHSQNDDLFGTTDFAVALIYEEKDEVRVEIIVLDYKHGRGVNVEPTSPQVKYYACLVIDLLMAEFVVRSWQDIAEVHLCIVQPRQPHPGGPVRNHLVTGDQLKEWFDTELLEAVRRTKDPDALLVVGEQCKFCPAKECCPAVRASIHEFSMEKEPEKLTPAEMADVMLLYGAISKYVERVQASALKAALSGKKIRTEDGRGFKLVDKQTNRVFKSGVEAQAKKEFGRAAYTEPELLSPAQMEKLEGGKDFVARWAFKPQVGFTLAPLSDKRDELKPAKDRLQAIIDEEG